MLTAISGLLFIVLILLLVSLFVAYAGTAIYGVYLSFKKKWYIGVASLIVPGFALVVGVYKLITKKDLLK